VVVKLLCHGSVEGVLKANFMCESDRSEIAHDVLSYLSTHAEAGDTLEGIVEWWLLERRIRRGNAQIREALDELTAKQLIRAHKGRDTKVHYRINRRKEKAIRALVEGKDE
jgi:hypothetical protein